MVSDPGDEVGPDARAPVPAGAIDHIAHAVPNLEEALAFYARVFGCAVTEPVTSPQQGVRLAYALLPGARIELMEPTSSDSPAARFLERNPAGGLHHVCLTTPDAAAAAAGADGLGLRARASAPLATGWHGRSIFFLHPKKTLGALFEIEEHK